MRWLLRPDREVGQRDVAADTADKYSGGIPGPGGGRGASATSGGGGGEARAAPEVADGEELD